MFSPEQRGGCINHCPRVCPFIKDQCPRIWLSFLTWGNNVTQTLKFTHDIHCKRFTKNQVRAKPNVSALWKAPPSRCCWGKHRSLYANEDGKEQGSDYLKIGLVRLKCSKIQWNLWHAMIHQFRNRAFMNRPEGGWLGAGPCGPAAAIDPMTRRI